MPPQAPWSPTAHAFAHHQFSHVANFWKQGRQASFCLEVLPGGQAELNLTFQLSPASEVVPPPSHVPPVPAPHRPIHPLFPESTSPKVASKRQRKNYRRSVLHRAALNAASSTLPPPKNGSLRQAASACAQRQQTDLVSTQSAKKRPLPNSPSHIPPLAQRIRKDIQIGESEAESPEKEVLRGPPFLENSPAPFSPCSKGIPSPAPLVFTPVPPETSSLKCLNCGARMTPDHQCEEIVAEQKFSEFRMRWIERLDKSTDDWALKTELLETLEDAYLAPVSVLSDGDLNAVKDQFFEGLLSPVKFLEKLQNLLGKNW